MAQTSLAVLALCVALSAAHVCIISPAQRGALDVSDAGDSSCFRHGGPCGGKNTPTGGALPTYLAGETMFIKFQQNLNHYQIGFPGYIDIAYSTVPTPTSDDNFTVIAVIPDTNWQQQSHQQNYTVSVVAPGSPCTNCVLRVRYNAHKSGEDTFYQCSDFAVLPASSKKISAVPALAMKKKSARWAEFAATSQIAVPANAKSLYGFAYSPVSGGSAEYVSLDTSSAVITHLAKLNFGVLSLTKPAAPLTATADVQYALDQVFAYDASSDVAFLIVHQTGSMDVTPATLFTIDGGMTQKVVPLTGLPAPLNAIVYTSTRGLLGLAITNTATPGTYVFNVVSIAENGAVTIIASSAPEGLFVNYQWITYDSTRNIVYFLMGDENAPFDLDNRLYALNLANNAITYTLPDYKTYTISAVQYMQGIDALVAASPGLFTVGSTPAWSLVKVDTSAAATVTKLCDIAPAGLFAPFYGGNVWGADQASNTVFLRLDIPDEPGLSMIASVNVKTCEVTFSQPAPIEHVRNIAVHA